MLSEYSAYYLSSEPYPTKQQGDKLATNVTVAIFNKCS
jgi:hypothetical protein